MELESTELMGVRKDKVRVKRKTLEAVLQQCQLALQQLASGCDDDDDDDEDDEDNANGELDAAQDSGSTSSAPATRDTDGAEFYGFLKSGVEGADFLKKLENAQASQNLAEEGSSWDMVSENDLWDDENLEIDPEDYVLVGQEDIMDGIASFMTAYLLSIKQTKDLTPNQLQAALGKTFSIKKKKSKLRKAWDGSKVIYNVASWGATAVGIYQNPALLRAASSAFWTSCHVISKLF
ncbi:hypothetical protein CDL12_17934 [Handroanthus impetiginosus]|uniref:Uncharacterized protein n=1 Tax=Handroanthus impetiginosus TaxID=429701 RepID=A0A2G9GW19_9LAMI|nr:hypothetical protein CDL12_17934 [Handroanthus impetiginosus]